MVILMFFAFLVVLALYEHHEEIREGVGLLWWEYYTPLFLLRFLNL